MQDTRHTIKVSEIEQNHPNVIKVKGIWLGKRWIDIRQVPNGFEIEMAQWYAREKGFA
jgi:hypothetical protein